MAMRNAFENLATESKQDTTITRLDTLTTEVNELLTEATFTTEVNELLTEATFTAEDFAHDATLQDVKRALTDFETRLDYDTRADGNPVYVGKAAQGTLTTTTSWTVQKLSYDSSNRLTRAQVLSGIAWDDRTTAGWS